MGRRRSWIGAMALVAVAGCGSTSGTGSADRPATSWARTASPCDGLTVTPTTTVTVALPPSTQSPDGSPPTIAPVNSLIELQERAAALGLDSDFAGVGLPGDDGSILVRTRSGQLPAAFAPLTPALRFDGQPSRWSAREVHCVLMRQQAMHDPVCEAISNRFSAIGYDPTDDTVAFSLPIHGLATTVDEVATTFGLDPTTIKVVPPPPMQMTPMDYPPFCPPCPTDQPITTTTAPSVQATVPCSTNPHLDELPRATSAPSTSTTTAA